MPNNHRHPGGKLRLHNLALAVASLDIMINWYEKVLGFTVAERGRFDVVGADYALIESDGLRLELISQAAEQHRQVDRTMPPDHLNVLGWKALVLETDNLSATTAFLVENNVEMIWADQQLADDWRSTMIRDPEGNLINILGPRHRIGTELH